MKRTLVSMFPLLVLVAVGLFCVPYTTMGQASTPTKWRFSVSIPAADLTYPPILNAAVIQLSVSTLRDGHRKGGVGIHTLAHHDQRETDNA